MRLGVVLLVFLCTNMILLSQDEMLNRMNRRDSIKSMALAKFSRSTAVTSEIHNILFRNIYATNSINEEEVFQQEISRLNPFDCKIIDTIVFIQMNVFGESVYDTSIHSNKFENFLSNSLHVNTRHKVIRNRYLFLKEGDYFSPFTAYENARLIRSSGIFHDVRIEPYFNGRDSQHILLIYRIQDVFPYGFSLGYTNINDFSLSIVNANVAGLNHQLNLDCAWKSTDSNNNIGLGFRYTIPNIINKSFIDGYAAFRSFHLDRIFEFGFFREFVKRELRWAGGNITTLRDIDVIDTTNFFVSNRYIENNMWLSHSFNLEQSSYTQHGIVVGLGLKSKYNFQRPTINANEQFKYSNYNFMLASIGYARIRFNQDRLLNGFGRTEDVPVGVSIAGLYGIDFNEFANRNYYGGQLLAQYQTRRGYYVNMSARIGFFMAENTPSQGVFDLNFQRVSKVYKLGSFRLRNYFKLRTTIGVNQDYDIRLNENNGIRGLRNSNFHGRSRFTSGFQSNLFIPFSFLGFRFSLFALGEIAKIQPSFNNFFETPVTTGITAGIALKNENLIFDVIQIQYGFYPSTSSLDQRGVVISSILPFNFQRLDISRPRIVQYE